MRVGALHIQQPRRPEHHVGAPEDGRRIVRGQLFALQRHQGGRHRDAGRLGIELHDVRDLQAALLGRTEEERAIVRERPAKRTTELLLLVIQRAIERVGRRQRFVAAEIEPLAVHGVRSGLGDDVDEPAVGASDFRARSAPDHLEFEHRGLGKEEHRVVAAALVALQRVVEIGAVDRDVRVDGPLAGNDEAVAIGLLRDRRRQLHELGEVASTDRQIRHGARADDRRGGGLVFVEQRRRGRDRDGLDDAGDLEAEVDRFGRTDAQAHGFPPGPCETRRRRLHEVGADRHRGREIAAARIGEEGALVARLGAQDRHERRGNRLIARIRHRTFHRCDARS